MAERKWTTEQRQCIEARSGTLLVSAAAGSGKTSVLVERIIGRITDPVHPVDVDRLLVVTFTRPAAGGNEAAAERRAIRAGSPPIPMISGCSGSRCCCRREHQHHSRLLLGPAAGEFSSSGAFPAVPCRRRGGNRPAAGGSAAGNARRALRGRPGGFRRTRGSSQPREGRQRLCRHRAPAVHLYSVPPLPGAMAGGKSRHVRQ